MPSSGILSAACPPSVHCRPPDSRLRNGEDTRSAFSEVQEAVMPEIQEQIQDYRSGQTRFMADLFSLPLLFLSSQAELPALRHHHFSSSSS